MNKRLKELRKFLKMNQEDFGKKLGVTAAGISKLESGDRNVTQQMLLSICREFNVSENWLRTGNGSMFNYPTDNRAGQLAKEMGLDEFALRALSAYQKLDKVGRETMKQFILDIAASYNAVIPEELTAQKEQVAKHDNLPTDAIRVYTTDEHNRLLEETVAMLLQIHNEKSS